MVPEVFLPDVFLVRHFALEAKRMSRTNLGLEAFGLQNEQGRLVVWRWNTADYLNAEATRIQASLMNLKFLYSRLGLSVSQVASSCRRDRNCDSDLL